VKGRSKLLDILDPTDASHSDGMRLFHLDPNGLVRFSAVRSHEYESSDRA